MCFGNHIRNPGPPTPEWIAFKQALEDIPPGHVRAVADALKALGKEIVEKDFHRGMGLLDGGGLLSRANGPRGV